MTDIRTLTLADTEPAARLVAASFAERLHPYMTYTQAGASQYLALPLRYPNLFPRRRLRAVGPPGAPVAFAEWQSLHDDSLFLSYICVDPAARGRGIAEAMIRDEVGQFVTRSIALDVFEDNGPALGLYGRLGFKRTVQNAVWSRRRLPVAQGSISVRDGVAAAASLDRYGFCEMTGADERGEFQFGIIGTSVIRCRDADLFDDDTRLGSIRALFPAVTEALFIGQDVVGGDQFNRSLRLEADAPFEDRK